MAEHPDHGLFPVALVSVALGQLAAGIGVATGFGIVFGSCAPACLDRDVLCVAVCRNAWAMFPILFALGAVYAIPTATLGGLRVGLLARVGPPERGKARATFATIPAAFLGLLGGIVFIGFAMPRLSLAVLAWAAAIGGVLVLSLGLAAHRVLTGRSRTP